MKIGLLWYDDSDRPLAEKVALACARYQRKYGEVPNTCCVHPSALERPFDVGSVTVEPRPTILRYHLWIGKEQRETLSIEIDSQ